jgi:pyruvate dehydrogenase E1 component alpha subunit
VDGNDAFAVYEAVSESVDRAREGEGPALIECKTYRWRTHFEGEPDTYRPPEEVAAWLKREPIAPFRRKLIETGVIGEEDAANIEARVIMDLDEAVDFARKSPDPDPATAMEDLWA